MCQLHLCHPYRQSKRSKSHFKTHTPQNRQLFKVELVKVINKLEPKLSPKYVFQVSVN